MIILIKINSICNNYKKRIKNNHHLILEIQPELKKKFIIQKIIQN